MDSVAHTCLDCQQAEDGTVSLAERRSSQIAARLILTPVLST